MSEYLLIDGTQIPVTSELAQVVGLNKAIVLQEIHYWCRVNKREKRQTHKGYYWVYNSYSQWTQAHFPWWNEKTVRNIFSDLEKQGLIVSDNFNKIKMDRTKWYRVNYTALRDMIVSSGKNCLMDWEGLAQPIPEVKPERNVNGDFPSDSTEESLSVCVDNDNSIYPNDIDLNAFVDWYFVLYMRILGEKHPNIKTTQRKNIIEQLSSFLADYPDVNTDGLHEMARTFFLNVKESDWRIFHFADHQILKHRYLEVYCHGYEP